MALDKLGLAEPMLATAKSPPPILSEYSGQNLIAEIIYATVAHEPYSDACKGLRSCSCTRPRGEYLTIREQSALAKSGKPQL
jgi:hypothetical protein